MSHPSFSFEVEAGKQHHVVANSDSSENIIVQVVNSDASVMRVLLYTDPSGAQKPETIAVRPNCGGIYSASRIVVRAVEDKVRGSVTYLGVA